MTDSRSHALRALEFDFEGKNVFLARARLPDELLQARFATFSRDQLRHCTNLRTLQSSSQIILIFDFEQTGTLGLQPTTVIAISPVPATCGDFSNLAFQLPRLDAMTDISATEKWLNNRPALYFQKGTRIRRYLYAQNPNQYRLNKGWKVDEWLEDHPELNVEFRQAKLLIYKPDCLIEPDQLGSAVENVRHLAGHLNQL